MKPSELKPQEANKAKNAIEADNGLDVLTSNPIRISMNMTGRCNIRCVYCHLTYSKYYTSSELDLEVFKKLEPVLPTLSHLVYFSSTEPLAARHFKAIFNESRRYGSEKYLSTNALLMDGAMSRLLVEGGLYYLTISVAGLTRESFKSAHQVDGLNRLIANIEMLNRIKAEHGTDLPRLRLVFVTWRDNARELPEAVRFAHRFGFSEGIKITYLKVYGDHLSDQLPFDHQEEVGRWVAEARAVGAQLNVPVSFDGGDFDALDDHPLAAPHRLCQEPFQRIHVEADGKVRCCPSAVNNIFVGDLTHQSVEEIWNGEGYREFRRRVNSDTPPDPCRNCTHNFHKNFRRRDIWDQRDLDLTVFKRLPKGNHLKSGDGN